MLCLSKKIKLSKALLGLALINLFSLAMSSNSSAIHINGDPIQNGAEVARGYGVPTTIFGETGTITNFVQILLFVVGGLSVIMIIVGGLRYVVSGGDSKNISDAKNTILYAIVGLIVATLAYAIVNFVLGSFSGGGTTGTDL